MKTMNLIQRAAAAILMAAAAFLMTGTAAAQSPMTANVPFSFQYGGVSFPAGEYRVDTQHSLENGIVIVQNTSTHQAVARVGSASPVEGPASQPRLVFRCGEAGCVLNQVWSPDIKEQFPSPKGFKAQYSASISIPLTSIHTADLH